MTGNGQAVGTLLKLGCEIRDYVVLYGEKLAEKSFMALYRSNFFKIGGHHWKINC